MGKKISVDSATMVNKVLEKIEAAILFSLVLNNIGILISFSTGLFEHPNVRIVIARKGIREIEFFKINLLAKGI